MLLSAVYVLVVAQSSSEVLEGLMNNPVFNVFKADLTTMRTVVRACLIIPLSLYQLLILDRHCPVVT